MGPYAQWKSRRGFDTRPATPMIWMGRCFRSRARSTDVTMMHVALSVSTQQSRRGSGLTIHREADQRLSGRAAPHHVHVEVEPDTEVGGHAVGERRVAALVVEHPVHVGRFEPGVEDRLADRLHGHRPRRAPGAARVLRLSDADDAVLVPEPATLDDHPSGASSVFWTLGLSPRYPAAARCYH